MGLGGVMKEVAEPVDTSRLWAVVSAQTLRINGSGPQRFTMTTF